MPDWVMLYCQRVHSHMAQPVVQRLYCEAVNTLLLICLLPAHGGPVLPFPQGSQHWGSPLACLVVRA